MGNVHVLPPDVVAKIAAGEVIDRPSSVVKELIENALDAGATQIDLKLKDAGKTTLTIRDNGSGIERDDLPNVFLRHATSKIRHSDDLFNIHSLGFRGEALYAIAAIADVQIQSRIQSANSESASGWSIHVRGGEQLSLEPCSFSGHGTEIEIRELFFNTPARQKFLKSNAAEIGQVLGVVTPYTLLHPGARFRLTHQDKTLIDVAPAQNPLDRAADILNLNPQHLLTCQKIFPGNLAVDAVLGDMNIKRTRRDLQFLSVNGRPVQSKNISFHLNQVYRLVMAQNEFPFFVLNITMPPEDLDVNIHPTKREVKIKDEAQICSLLRSLVENTLMRQGQPKSISSPSPVQEPETITSRLARVNPPQHELETPGPHDLYVRETSSEDYAFPRQQRKPHEPFAWIQPQPQPTAESPWLIPPVSSPETSPRSALHEKLQNARYVGSFHQKFLLFENGASLLVIDQHAAQERIMYETLIRQMNQGRVEIQNLLSPVLISLKADEMLLWEEAKTLLTETGFDNNQWDRQTIAIHSHPTLISDIERAVRNLLGGEKINPQDHDTLARRACKASIRAGDKLSPEQADYQRQEILKCLDPFTCPHGRPTVIEITESFLDKQFLRS